MTPRTAKADATRHYIAAQRKYADAEAEAASTLAAAKRLAACGGNDSLSQSDA